MRVLPVPSALTSYRVPLATTQQRSQGQLSEGVSVQTLMHVVLKQGWQNIHYSWHWHCCNFIMWWYEGVYQRAVKWRYSHWRFDIGFVNGSRVIRICNKEDLSDVWAALRKPGNKMTWWCGGLVERQPNSRKQVQSEDVDSDREVTQVGPPKRSRQTAL